MVVWQERRKTPACLLSPSWSLTYRGVQVGWEHAFGLYRLGEIWRRLWHGDTEGERCFSPSSTLLFPIMELWVVKVRGKALLSSEWVWLHSSTPISVRPRQAVTGPLSLCLHIGAVNEFKSILGKAKYGNILLLQAVFLCLRTVNKIDLIQVSSEKKVFTVESQRTVIGLSRFKTYAMSPSMVSYHIYSLRRKTEKCDSRLHWFCSDIKNFNLQLRSRTFFIEWHLVSNRRDHRHFNKAGRNGETW